MNYTLLTAQDLQFNQVLDLVKDGNTYDVILTNKEKIFVTKYKSKKEAEEVYQKLIQCFIDGTYSFEQRAQFLKSNLIH